MMHNLAPILLFVYKRPTQTRQTLEALSRNMLADGSVLYIYADGPKEDGTSEEAQQIQEVRQLIRERQWCGEVNIIESPLNRGLANSIIDGVTQQVKEHGKVIVLEDDLVTAKGFLKYMNDALAVYERSEQVMQVCGFQFPIGISAAGAAFFMTLTNSWGWATWKRAWDSFDPIALGYQELKTNRALATRFDINGTMPYTDMLMAQMEKKTINSWAIRWWWSVFKSNGLTLFPDNSLVLNIGYGGDATHTTGSNPFGPLDFDPDYCITDFPEAIEVDNLNLNKLQVFNRKVYELDCNSLVKLLRKIKRKMLYLIGKA